MKLRLLILATLLMPMAGVADAAPIVLFYDDEAKFRTDLKSFQSLNFEGLVADNAAIESNAFTFGDVTLTSLNGSSTVGSLIVGKSAPASGAPYDSALFGPSITAADALATFNPGGMKITAVGGNFMRLFGNSVEPGFLTLTGTTGVLDRRAFRFGQAGAGRPKTFYGYMVLGDEITSLRIGNSASATAIDNFIYGATAVPEPASLAMIGLGLAGIGIAARRRKA